MVVQIKVTIDEYQYVIEFLEKRVRFTRRSVDLRGKENSDAVELTNHHERALEHFDSGNMRLDNGETFEAIGEYRAAIELWDNDARFYNNLGIAHRQRGELDEAEENLRQAIELDPRYRDAYSNLGLALLDREMYQEAVEHSTSAIGIDSNFWYAYNGKGISFLSTWK